LASISIQGLTKTFPNGTKALDSVDLEIGKSEMVALIGASGSGKSTLIRHIDGLVTADASTVSDVKIDNKSIQSGGQIASEVRQLRRNIGVIFQQFNLVNRMSVLTNVLTGRLGQMPVMNGILGFFSLADQQRAMQALDGWALPRWHASGRRPCPVASSSAQPLPGPLCRAPRFCWLMSPSPRLIPPRRAA
jgi:phosphonate transport system ATP-binding protein